MKSMSAGKRGGVDVVLWTNTSAMQVRYSRICVTENLNPMSKKVKFLEPKVGNKKCSVCAAHNHSELHLSRWSP